MTITASCLLKLPRLPLPDSGPVRAETLEDCVLLHTSLDFADDPDDLAGAIRDLLGESLAGQHQDPRGVYLIPSVAAPTARTYAGIVDEVSEGGVWATWSASAPKTQAPDLGAMLSGMLGQMPEGLFGAAAATLRENPDALRQATAQLPGLLSQPGALGDLLQQGRSQMPQLAEMMRAMGVDLQGPELAQITSGLQAELSRDPRRLLSLAESLFAGAGAAGQEEEEEEEEEEEQDGKGPR